MKRNISIVLVLTGSALLAIQMFFNTEATENLDFSTSVAQEQKFPKNSHRPLPIKEAQKEKIVQVVREKKKQEPMNMEEIDANIGALDREILDGDYVANSNTGALSEEEIKNFRILLKKRDQLFAKKTDLLLVD